MGDRGLVDRGMVGKGVWADTAGGFGGGMSKRFDRVRYI